MGAACRASGAGRRLLWPLALFALWATAPEARAQAAPEARALHPAAEAFAAERYREAARLSREAIRGGAEDAGLWTIRAASLLQTGRHAEAASASEAGLRAFPRSGPLALVRAEALLAMNAPAGALQILTRLQREAPPDLGLAPEALAERVGRAQLATGAAAAQAGRWAEAEPLLRAAARALPAEPEPRTALAYVLFSTGRAREAAEVAARALRETRETEPLLRIRLGAALAVEDLPAAADAARALQRRAPRDRVVALTRGQILTRLGRRDEATAVLEQYLADFADAPEAYDDLADLNEGAGNPLGAAEVLRRRQRALAADPAVQRRIAGLLRSVGELDEARAALDSVAVMGGDGREAGTAVAETFEAEGRWAEAAAAYRRLGPAPEAEGGASGEADRLRRLTAAERKAGNPLGWLDAAERWAALAPDDPTAALAHADALAAAQRPADARALYARLLAAPAGPPEAALGLARLTADSDSAAALAARAASGALRQSAALQRSALASAQQDGGLTSASGDGGKGAAGDLAASRQTADDALDLLTALDPARAAALVRGLVGDYPASASLWLRLAALHPGDPALVEDAMDAAVDLAPERLDVNLRAGAIYGAGGRTRDALLAYERALAIDDENREAYAALVDLAEASGGLAALVRRWDARARSTAPNAALSDALGEARRRLDAAPEASGETPRR